MTISEKTDQDIFNDIILTNNPFLYFNLNPMKFRPKLLDLVFNVHLDLRKEPEGTMGLNRYLVLLLNPLQTLH